MSKLTVKKNEDGKYGFVDGAGNWVIEPKFDEAEYFELGKAPVKIGDCWGIIESDGTWFREPAFEAVERSEDGDIIVYYDGIEGYVDEDSGEIEWVDEDDDE